MLNDYSSRVVMNVGGGLEEEDPTTVPALRWGIW